MAYNTERILPSQFSELIAAIGAGGGGGGGTISFDATQFAELTDAITGTHAFKAGDSFTTAGTFMGLTSSANTGFSVTVPVPQNIVANNVTISATVGWIRGGGRAVSTAGINIVLDSFKGNNIIVGVNNVTGLPGAITPIGIYFSSITFTFS